MIDRFQEEYESEPDQGEEVLRPNERQKQKKYTCENEGLVFWALDASRLCSAAAHAGSRIREAYIAANYFCEHFFMNACLIRLGVFSLSRLPRGTVLEFFRTPMNLRSAVVEKIPGKTVE